uniref:S-adenosyl-L-methionine-dependent methyltransferase n=1 Tax=Thermogemmatispora argillosa TaxID=2045280 RepID=A0A455T4F7_9CHLR|nr:S-adenosyl-L-methionine-dependent methyltransferase [Thermogemmatispora argillosa]
MSETVYSPTPKELISPTAFLTAAARAFESQRPDRLFNDPWAAVLAGHEGQRRFASVEDQGGSIIVRTRYFDEWLQRLAHEHNIRQIVLLAAGLDTRVFRFNWPSETRFFELDQPLILDYKEAVLKVQQAQPRCERVPVIADLAQPGWEEALLQAGFNPTLPSAWLVEGLLFYLPLDQISRLLEQISRLAAPDSWLGFDAIHSEMISSPLTRVRIDRLARSGAPWIGAIDDPITLLASLGWAATFVSSARKGYEYGRAVFPFIPPAELTLETEKLYHMLVTAWRKP